jgi:regulator of protease activity HflC (stomatin/prohibitin superfamily)
MSNLAQRWTALAMPLWMLTAGCLPHSLESTEAGVRTVRLAAFGSTGVVPEPYAPGQTYFFIPIINGWTVFDVGLQNLAMNTSKDSGAREGDDSLRFKTADGNDISVDVTIAWRVDPSKTPYLLQFVGSSTKEVEERLVRPVTRTVLRDVLNEMRSEQYYDTAMRFKKADQAREACAHYLGPEGVLIDQVLLGEHKFADAYEQVIKDKTVAEQEAARLRSESEAAAEQMKQELEVAKGQVNQTIETAHGDAAMAKLSADASYFQRDREAEALMAEAKARTEGLRAQARALAGSGGHNMVKLKVAEALAGKPILFMPASGGDLRTTNMNDLITKYAAMQAVGASAPTP